MVTGVVLLAHGSPDPDWRRPIEQLRDRLAALDPTLGVEAAYMAHADPSLLVAVQRLSAGGHRQIRVIAAFLSPGGGHIKRDLPNLVAEVRAAMPDVELILVPGTVGAQSEVVDAMARAAARLARG